jgi:hypothetical protein
MRISLHHQALRFAPAAKLAPGYEELLIGAKSVNGRSRRVVLLRILKSQLCNLHTRKITNRLTQYQLPRWMVGSIVAIELLYNASRLAWNFFRSSGFHQLSNRP